MQRRAHLAALGSRRQHHLVDQGAKGCRGFIAFGGLVEGLRQPRDLLAVDIGDVWVQVDGRGGRVRLLSAQDGHAVLQVVQTRHQGGGAPSVLNGVEDAGDRPLGLRQFRLVRGAVGAALVVEAVGLGDEGADGFRGGLGLHQLIAKPVEHPLLDLGSGDGAAIAAAVGVQVVRAGEAALAPQGVRTITAAAAQQAGEQ